MVCLSLALIHAKEATLRFLGKNYLSARQVCDRIGVSLRTLNRYALAEGFPKPLKFEQRRFWLEDDIAAWEGRTIARAMGQAGAADDAKAA